MLKIWNLYTQIQDWGTTIELFLLCTRAWRREHGEESQEGARDPPSLEPSRPAAPIQSLRPPCPRTKPGPPPRRRWHISSWSMEPSVRLHTFWFACMPPRFVADGASRRLALTARRAPARLRLTLAGRTSPSTLARSRALASRARGGKLHLRSGRVGM